MNVVYVSSKTADLNDFSTPDVPVVSARVNEVVETPPPMEPTGTSSPKVITPREPTPEGTGFQKLLHYNAMYITCALHVRHMCIICTLQSALRYMYMYITLCNVTLRYMYVTLQCTCTIGNRIKNRLKSKKAGENS